MSSRLQGCVPVGKSKGQRTCSLLYPTSWTQEKLDAEVAALEETYADVFLLLLDDEDMEGCLEHGMVSTWTHEKSLKHPK